MKEIVLRLSLINNVEIVSGAVFSRYVIKKFEQVFKVNTEKSTKFRFFQRRLGSEIALILAQKRQFRCHSTSPSSQH